MNRHYVYAHRRSDTGEIFYVGKGSIRPRQRTVSYERAYATHPRNKAWKRLVKECGFEVEILAHFKTDALAQEFEMAEIQRLGRADLGTGTLLNMTDGGDGHANIVVSDDLRLKRSKNASAPRSEAWVKSISSARKRTGNNGLVKQGDSLPEAWRQAIAAGQRGPNNYMRGRSGEKHPRARKVVNVDTGMIYPSVCAAAEAEGFNMKSLHNCLSGHRKNTTPLRFAT